MACAPLEIGGLHGFVYCFLFDFQATRAADWAVFVTPHKIGATFCAASSLYASHTPLCKADVVSDTDKTMERQLRTNGMQDINADQYFCTSRLPEHHVQRWARSMRR